MRDYTREQREEYNLQCREEIALSNPPKTEYKVKPYDGCKITFQANTGLLHITLGDTIISQFVPKEEQWEMECWMEVVERVTQ